jgi:NLI interacting factor-like phosphatase
MKLRLAFDLDETLGVPVIDGTSIIGFTIREGGVELLDLLQQEHSLVLWTVASRRYVDKVLSFGLNKYFAEVHSWDEIASEWKDIRKIRADYLIDDSPHHRERAREHGLERRYIVIAPYGSLEDRKDPRLWVQQIEQGLNSNSSRI